MAPRTTMSSQPRKALPADEGKKSKVEDEIEAEEAEADDQPSAAKSEAQDDGMEAILDSPKPFGIWIDYDDGKNKDGSPRTKRVLKRFQKGKTPLTAEEALACQNDSYVTDHEAEVIYRKKRV